jgi:hypothetical protein
MYRVGKKREREEEKWTLQSETHEFRVNRLQRNLNCTIVLSSRPSFMTLKGPGWRSFAEVSVEVPVLGRLGVPKVRPTPSSGNAARVKLTRISEGHFLGQCWLRRRSKEI